MALSVPLSRFTPRVGGGSAFFVRHSRHAFMKRISLIFVVWISATVIATAAWLIGSFAPLSLPEAYASATESLGSLTNAFKCIEAKRDKEAKQWEFVFEGTNASVTNIVVSDFYVDGDPKTRVLCRGVTNGEWRVTK